MLQNGVYLLKQDSSPFNGLEFKQNQELEVVSNVIYISGFPLPFDMQDALNKWMAGNPQLFLIDNRM
jgi:hypothetical protein